MENLPWRGSARPAELSYQSGPNTENLFRQQYISETISPSMIAIIQEHIKE